MRLHPLQKSVSNIPAVLNGELDDLIQDLRSADEAERLADAGITDNAAAAV